jgi:polar amino acid transport system substrate-binding protein
LLVGEPGNQKTPNVPQTQGDYVVAFRVGASSEVDNDTAGQTAPANISASGVVQGGAAPYTPAQVQAGQTAFAQSCAQCHGTQLQGVSAPALSGAAFGKSNLTIGSMRQIVAKQMPLTAPGTLSPQTYAAIMAYLLASNCVKPQTPAMPFPSGTPAPSYMNVTLVGAACSVEQKTE